MEKLINLMYTTAFLAYMAFAHLVGMTMGDGE